MKSKTKYIIVVIAIIAVAFFFYMSRTQIERLRADVGDDGTVSEVYQVSYIIGNDIKEKIREHNEHLADTNVNVGRIYLQNQRLRIENPFVLGDEPDYRKNKGTDIDNMDILCMVWKEKLRNGKDTVTFNFYDKDHDDSTIVTISTE